MKVDIKYDTIVWWETWFHNLNIAEKTLSLNV